MTSPAETLRPPRRDYIDWLRGLAVLIMIQAHTLDAWLRPADRTGAVFRDLTILGGFAAPLFLWLAGLALVLSAERTLERTGQRRDAAKAIAVRGLEIFILAFLFRIQAFVVSPGSWLVTIFRVDILNVMGPAIVAASVVWGLARTRTWAVTGMAVLATALAMAAPLVRTAGWVDLLPLWMQWYVRPFGDHSTFTLFPWAAFVFAGASVGAVLAGSSGEKSDRRVLTALAVSGALVLGLGAITAYRPAVYARSAFWTTSPTFFAIRVGILTVALGAAWAVAPVVRRLPSAAAALSTLGKNSLFVYWIHVELVYGYATWLIHRRLPFWLFVLSYVAFCRAMYAAISLRDRGMAAWRARRARKTATGLVTA